MSEKAPQFAVEARTFLLQNKHALLSTISLSQAGFPFGSIVPYDVTDNGDLIIYVSFIAEHYKNLAADSRASLVAANYFAYGDPQAFARATALCRFVPVPDSEKERVQKSYEERFPKSVNYEIAHNFLFMRGVIERIRWIGGFGDIGWVSPDRYRAATPDPLARDAHGILQHMNEDHPDALFSYIKAFGGYDPKDEGLVTMTEISSTTFTVAHAFHGENRSTEVQFPVPVTTSEAARVELIKLLKHARSL